MLVVNDSKTHISVSKRDATNGDEELPGATMQILEGTTVVRTWVSGDTPEQIEGLKTGVTYTLRETIAPDGYTITSDTTFSIDEYGNVTSNGTHSKGEDGIEVLVVNDRKTHVEVKKTDIANGEEVAGATLVVLDKDGKEVDSWTTVATGDNHIIEGLKTGEANKYTLRETVAPEGYTVTTDITFWINESGKVQVTGARTADENGNKRATQSSWSKMHGRTLKSRRLTSPMARKSKAPSWS